MTEPDATDSVDSKKRKSADDNQSAKPTHTTQWECPICFDSLGSAANVLPCLLVPCGHAICFACIEQLQEKQLTKCSICAQQYTSFLPFGAIANNADEAVVAANKKKRELDAASKSAAERSSSHPIYANRSAVFQREINGDPPRSFPDFQALATYVMQHRQPASEARRQPAASRRRRRLAAVVRQIMPSYQPDARTDEQRYLEIVQKIGQVLAARQRMGFSTIEPGDCIRVGLDYVPSCEPHRSLLIDPMVSKPAKAEYLASMARHLHSRVAQRFAGVLSIAVAPTQYLSYTNTGVLGYLMYEMRSVPSPPLPSGNAQFVGAGVLGEPRGDGLFE